MADDEFQASSTVIELVRRVQNTQVFLRLAAAELRRIADQELNIAAELRQMAQQLVAEAEDLARHDANQRASVDSRRRGGQCFTLSK